MERKETEEKKRKESEDRKRGDFENRIKEWLLLAEMDDQRLFGDG